MLTIVRPFEPFPTAVTRTIFLAGPSPRSDEIPSWRPEALALLEELRFDGHVYLPEASDANAWMTDPDLQEVWEDEALHRADAVAFWVPRDFTPDATGKPRMPAGTTNMEFGEFLTSGRIVLGVPPKAPQTHAMKQKAARYGVPVCTDMYSMLLNALFMVGDGAVRDGGECSVPINVWRFEAFQHWYAVQRKRLDLTHVRLVSRYPLGHHQLTNIGIEARLVNRESGREDTVYLRIS